jgi:hypothetical protein
MTSVHRRIALLVGDGLDRDACASSAACRRTRGRLRRVRSVRAAAVSRIVNLRACEPARRLLAATMRRALLPGTAAGRAVLSATT